MNKIKTTIGVAALVVSTAACTPNQMAFWAQRQAEVAATPDLQDDADLIDQYGALPDVPDTPCNEWFWWAIEAGWPAELWPFLAHIMPRESHCDPGAHNPSGATGLTQIMPMWADDCGGSPGDLYDPMFNLKCALLIYNVQGPNAWSTW